MKRKDKINKLGDIKTRNRYHWDLGTIAFGKDEEPRVKVKEKGVKT
jgi:hypothetical protein